MTEEKAHQWRTKLGMALSTKKKKEDRWKKKTI
jgi:hypothetical protein